MGVSGAAHRTFRLTNPDFALWMRFEEKLGYNTLGIL
jgi:hypothetical protein